MKLTLRSSFNLVLAAAGIYVSIAFATLLQRWIAQPRLRTHGNAHTLVWANTRSGFYYCPKTSLYGNIQPGKYLAETDALQAGYRPALRETCP